MRRVMDDQRAILFATDPPYLVNYDGTNHPGKRGQNVHRHGWDTVSPLLGVWMRGPKPGPWPQQDSFVEIDHPNVALLTIKPAEDRRGHIIRVIETAGQAGDVTVSLPHLQFSSAIETNLVEEDLAPAECGEGTVTFHAEPFRYHTIRLLGFE